jgi:hypothetical protein
LKVKLGEFGESAERLRAGETCNSIEGSETPRELGRVDQLPAKPQFGELILVD